MLPPIRRATWQDAPAIARFNRQLAWETERLRLDESRLRDGVEALLADPSKGFYLLALAGGQPAGQLMITFEWSDWRNGLFWWIQSVWVEPAFRGQGVFKSLYREVERQAHLAKGVCGLRLYVEAANHHAQSVYEHLGMQRAGYQMFEIDFSGTRPAPDEAASSSTRY